MACRGAKLVHRNHLRLPMVNGHERCARCGAYLSLGPSNDDIPDDEMQIAIGIAIGLRGHP